MLVTPKRPDDFIEIAERGIFAYDWSDVERTIQEQIEAYQPMAAPSVPVNVAQLPQDLAQLVKLSELADVTFDGAAVLDVRRSLRCVSPARLGG